MIPSSMFMLILSLFVIENDGLKYFDGGSDSSGGRVKRQAVGGVANADPSGSDGPSSTFTKSGVELPVNNFTPFSFPGFDNLKFWYGLFNQTPPQTDNRNAGQTVVPPQSSGIPSNNIAIPDNLNTLNTDTSNNNYPTGFQNTGSQNSNPAIASNPTPKINSPNPNGPDGNNLRGIDSNNLNANGIIPYDNNTPSDKSNVGNNLSGINSNVLNLNGIIPYDNTPSGNNNDFKENNVDIQSVNNNRAGSLEDANNANVIKTIENYPGSYRIEDLVASNPLYFSDFGILKSRNSNGIQNRQNQNINTITPYGISVDQLFELGQIISLNNPISSNHYAQFPQNTQYDPIANIPNINTQNQNGFANNDGNINNNLNTNGNSANPNVENINFNTPSINNGVNTNLNFEKERPNLPIGFNGNNNNENRNSFESTNNNNVIQDGVLSNNNSNNPNSMDTSNNPLGNGNLNGFNINDLIKINPTEFRDYGVDSNIDNGNVNNNRPNENINLRNPITPLPEELVVDNLVNRELNDQKSRPSKETANAITEENKRNTDCYFKGTTCALSVDDLVQIYEKIRNSTNEINNSTGGIVDNVPLVVSTKRLQTVKNATNNISNQLNNKDDSNNGFKHHKFNGEDDSENLKSTKDDLIQSDIDARFGDNGGSSQDLDDKSTKKKTSSEDPNRPETAAKADKSTNLNKTNESSEKQAHVLKLNDCQIDCHKRVSNAYDPFCGSDNNTYSNPGKVACAINCGKTLTATTGPCVKSDYVI